jgi:hypothetical protein
MLMDAACLGHRSDRVTTMALSHGAILPGGMPQSARPAATSAEYSGIRPGPRFPLGGAAPPRLGCGRRQYGHEVFRVSQFDQHRHHGTSRILFRIQVDDKRVSCSGLPQSARSCQRPSHSHSRTSLCEINTGATRSASGVQQATQTGCRLGFDRCSGVADHNPLRVDPSDQSGDATLARSDEIVYHRS